MVKNIFVCTLFVLLSTSCLSAPRHRRTINWNGNDWAMACDFKGNDLSNAQVAAALCGPTCVSTSGCTHFTWTQYNGGTCWMKQGAVSKDDAISTSDSTMVCGITNTNSGGGSTSGGSQTSKTGKRGIAWPLENKQDSPDALSSGKITWVYDWSPYSVSIFGAEFVPMLWGSDQNHDGSQFFNQAEDAKVVLGFNEPERDDQAHMSVGGAVQAWKQFIEPLQARGIRLGSPAIASTDQGLNWLSQFIQQLDQAGSHVDFIALHWYGRGADNFINWITHVRQTLGNKYPVWVTEFACTSWDPNQPVSQQEVNDFMQDSISKLESLPWVERYAWFGAQRQLDPAIGQAITLFSSDGQLSQLGQNYVHGF